MVQQQHQLLVTLLLCNAVAMEALPIFLNYMFNEFVAVVLSVTFVLAFGEIEGLWFRCQVIPQAVCSRHGLSIGASLIWLVKILMLLCWPISYPVGKVSLLHHKKEKKKKSEPKQNKTKQNNLKAEFLQLAFPHDAEC